MLLCSQLDQRQCHRDCQCDSRSGRRPEKRCTSEQRAAFSNVVALSNLLGLRYPGKGCVCFALQEVNLDDEANAGGGRAYIDFQL